MCGLYGVIGGTAPLSEEEIRNAHDVQQHRGPDARGSWTGIVGEQCVTFGHERLAIIDLSAAGTQPMRDEETGGQILIFNGEIYNYIELRAQLEREGHRFRTRTDTEVILAALNRWGIDEAHQRFNGMWAFACVDLDRRRLVLSRDRGGEKPLYYCVVDNRLLFASEIKTLLALSGRRFAVNSNAVAQYLEQSLLDTGEETFFEGIRKLPAAHYATVDLNAATLGLRIQPYWTPGLSADSVLPLDEYTEQLRATFEDSVRIRMRSDVPVGVLLSGGLDSSAIAAAMARANKNADLNLLSAVSDDPEYDESPFIDKMAAFLDRPVHRVQLQLGPDNAISLLECASWHNDEPIGSFANVAHYLLMERARNLGITVIMSGQGADELLCGYKKYLGFYAEYLFRSGKPIQAAKLLGGFIKNRTILPQFRLTEARAYLPAFFSRHRDSVLGNATREYNRVALGVGSGTLQERQLKDVTRFSIPVLCHSEDRMSMAHSREIRLPFLDVRLMETLLAAPPDYKLRAGWTKYAFRKAMADVLPSEITWRKDKRGFVNPQARWLKGRLRPVVLNLFGPESLIFRERLVDREVLLARYEQYCREPEDRGVYFREIFSPLALEIWMRQYEAHLC
jgi:asparagine synthase (glutamine-hydrolysing)